VTAEGYRQDGGYFSTLHQTSPDNFVWILAQDLATLQALQASVED
jgi:hypothetical protein